MHDWLTQIATEFADRDFVVTDDRSYSYCEIQQWSRNLAAGLSVRGIGAGDHVAVLMANYPEYVAVKFALSMLGAVTVPINVMYRREELRFVLRHSDAAALITMTGFRDLDYLDMLDDIATGWDAGLPTESLPRLRFVAQFEATAPVRPGVPTLAEIAALGRRLPLPLTEIRADDASTIFYTSGTTGSPKGVIWTHNAEARLGYGGALTRAFGDGWRVQSALPLFHAFANNEVMHAAMFAGGALIPRLRFDVEDFVAAVTRHRPSEIVTVPTMVVALCEAPIAAGSCMDSLVGLMCAGAPAPARLWEKAVARLGVREVTTGYGMTETGGGQVMSRPEDGIDRVATTVGRIKCGGVAAEPGMNGLLAEVRTVDPLTAAPLPAGDEGELISRGPTNAVGYWKDPDATAETFRDGWVFTGDLGRVLDDGSIQLTGRKKELIRCGGENFAPKEVEELLTRHPGVSQVFVVGVPDLKWGEVGCAWVVLEPGANVTADELTDLCRARLAVFKQPRHVRFIVSEALPKTPTGKVQKIILKQMAVQISTSGSAQGPECSP